MGFGKPSCALSVGEGMWEVQLYGRERWRRFGLVEMASVVEIWWRTFIDGRARCTEKLPTLGNLVVGPTTRRKRQ